MKDFSITALLFAMMLSGAMAQETTNAEPVDATFPLEPPLNPDSPQLNVPPLLSGWVQTATGTCKQGESWHWQCGNLWKPAAEVALTDLIAVCSTGRNTACASEDRRWLRVLNIQPDSTLIRSCGVMPDPLTSKNGCKASYIRFATVSGVIPPVEIPAAPLLSTAAASVAEPIPEPAPLTENSMFQNVTAEVLDKAVRVNFHFWSGMPDVNGDGCLDLFLGSHTDATPSAMYIHTKDGNACAGKFTYFPQNGNYTQPLPKFPRVSSRYMWGNFYGHPDGLWSYLGQDVDVGTSARYTVSGLEGDRPVYEPKSTGCFKSSCIPADVDGDGVIEMVSRGIVRDVKGDPVITLSASDRDYGNIMTVFDVDNDGYIDILHPIAQGYWSYNPATDDFDWRANTFPATTLHRLAGSGHLVPLDYDNDGDLDLYIGQGTYSAEGADSVETVHGPSTFTPHLFRNDNGVFAETTQAAGLDEPGLLRNAYYFSTYGNSLPVDVNLDGYVDIIYGSETRVDTAESTHIVMILNNGDGTFRVDRETKFGNFTSEANNSGRPWVNVGDFDNDGRIDLIKTHTYSSPTHESVGLFRNIVANENHWMRFRVQGRTSDGLQARIVIRRPGSEDIISSQQVGVFTSSLSNLIPHFGLGNNDVVDIDVYFPHGGPKYTFSNIQADQDLIVRLDGTIVQNYQPGTSLLQVTAPAQ